MKILFIFLNKKGMPVINRNIPRIEFPSENLIISRYMDLPKFLSMVATSKLFLARLDMMEDKYEGTVPKVSFDHLKQFYERVKKTNYLKNGGSKTPEQFASEQKNFVESSKKYVAINCWSRFESENYALWKIFAKTDTGIMIKSDVSKLVKSLENEKRELWLSEVFYINPDKEGVRYIGNNIQYYIYKNNAFKYENEIRLMFDHKNIKGFDWNNQENKFGIYTQIDLNILIDEIILGPDCQDWFLKVIKSLCEKYNIDKPIKISSLKYHEE